MLVNKCIIYYEDSRARSANHKILGEKKGKDKNRGKPYWNLTDKGKQKAASGKERSKGDTSASVRCFKCGEFGHHIFSVKEQM